MKRMAIVMVSSLLVVGGCQSSKDEAPPQASAKEVQPKVRAPRPAVPSGTLFSRVKHGQTMKEVVALIGDADESRGHLMGKNFIPFYFGKDRYRTTWYYKGEGRLIFNTGARVMKIERDKKEDGTRD